MNITKQICIDYLNNKIKFTQNLKEKDIFLAILNFLKNDNEK